MRFEVTSEDLRKMEEELSGLVQKARTRFERITGILEQTESVFSVKGTREMKAVLCRIREDGNAGFAGLRTQTEKLLQIAAEYEEAERRNCDDTGDLGN